jgi:hypothetical protein
MSAPAVHPLAEPPPVARVPEGGGRPWAAAIGVLLYLTGFWVMVGVILDELV